MQEERRVRIVAAELRRDNGFSNRIRFSHENSWIKVETRRANSN